MDLALLSAVELLAISDEEVVPLASEMAQVFASRGEGALRAVVLANHRCYQLAGGDGREELVRLTASSLVALAAARPALKLRQLPSRTRVVRVDRRDLAAFRLGALRHVAFSIGLYDVPRAYDVVRLVELDGDKLTGADVLAEITYVTQHPGDVGTTYVASVRPWRGAGTDGGEEAFLRGRRQALDELEELLLRLASVCQDGTVKGRLRGAALRVLERVRAATVVDEPVAAE
jgi:hypothetical protein